jgi:hypothetical protein
MSKIEVNAIEPQCGTTLTLGANNDKIVLGTGASFGGGVAAINWETTAQAGDFGALSGRGYFVNTTSAPRTVTLPATPSAGDIVAFADYALTWDTNNLILDPGSNKINGDTTDYIVSSEGKSLTLLYVDSTQGWKVVNDGNSNAGSQAQYIVATGGTITCCGDYKIHTFTGPGTFTVCSVGNPLGSDSVDYLVVAGGGSGGSRNGGSGGGGAGGYREGYNPGSYTASPLATSALPVSASPYPISVGGGGAPQPSCNSAQGNAGSNSIFSSITSTGGGGGGGLSSVGPITGGAPGGSGGGAGIETDNVPFSSAGSGNTPPVSPPQGNPGGNNFATSFPSPSAAGGGGGGAGGAGGNGSSGTGGGRGDGAISGITGSPAARSQGGAAVNYGSPLGGVGGNNPSPATTDDGVPGGTNTGGGGGAAGSGANSGSSGAGGSGIVIIRYKFQ